MSKFSFLIFFTLLFYISTSAQVLVHQFFPMMINVDMFGDTLINKKEILVKAGIRKMNIRQIPPIVSTTMASKTYSFDQNGNIESLQYCFYNPKSDSSFCMNEKLWYSSNGQLYELKSFDSKETVHIQYTVERLDKNSVKCILKIRSNGVSGDTLVDYKYYNEKGQLIKSTQMRKARDTGYSLQEPGYSLYHYNIDGLLDSVSYPNTHWPTNKFSRKYKGKDKIIEMEHPMGRYSWIYNSSGQCIRILFETKTQSGPLNNQQLYLFGNPKTKYKKKMEVFFYYNSNGTLSKSTEKQSDGQELNVIYSYE